MARRVGSTLDRSPPGFMCRQEDTDEHTHQNVFLCVYVYVIYKYTSNGL